MTPERLAEIERALNGVMMHESSRRLIRKLLAAAREGIVAIDLLRQIQFGDHGYCSACGGWNADPKDPDRGCTPKVHTETCPLKKLIEADK